jgi:hypothetical protein
MSELEQWAERAAAELGLPETGDLGLLLRLSKQVAHGVVRPAAPVTTYLLGVAVGRGADLHEAAQRLLALVPPEAETS